MWSGHEFIYGCVGGGGRVPLHFQWVVGATINKIHFVRKKGEVIRYFFFLALPAHLVGFYFAL